MSLYDMIKKYKIFSEYQIENEIFLDILPEETVHLILDEILTKEIKYIPKNVYGLNKNNLSNFNTSTKIEFIKNIDNILKEEDILINNADILSVFTTNDLILNKIAQENDYDRITNPLYEKLFEQQKNVFNRIIKDGNDKSIILADTGTGKTITALAIAEEMFLSKKIHRIIIVSERDKNIWYDEMIKHLPTYAMSKYSITTYFAMYKDVTLKNTNGVLFILDEVHLLKNISKRSEFINSLNIKTFIGLTATLFDKKSDLIQLEHNLNINNINDIIYKMELMDIKYKINKYTIPLKLSINEMELFKFSIGTTDIKELYSKRFDNIHKQAQLLSLRSRKITELLLLVEKHKNDKIILFTNYINTANTLEEIIPNSMKILGGTSKDDIKKKLDIFFYGKFNTLITTSVLAQSYNLQEANVIVFFDFDLNSIKDMQTEGRIKRIGQNKDIYIYYIYHVGTIEEVIYNIVEEKKEEYAKYKELIK